MSAVSVLCLSSPAAQAEVPSVEERAAAVADLVRAFRCGLNFGCGCICKQMRRKKKKSCRQNLWLSSSSGGRCGGSSRSSEQVAAALTAWSMQPSTTTFLYDYLLYKKQSYKKKLAGGGEPYTLTILLLHLSTLQCFGAPSPKTSWLWWWWWWKRVVCFDDRQTDGEEDGNGLTENHPSEWVGETVATVRKWKWVRRDRTKVLADSSRSLPTTTTTTSNNCDVVCQCWWWWSSGERHSAQITATTSSTTSPNYVRTHTVCFSFNCWFYCLVNVCVCCNHAVDVSEWVKIQWMEQRWLWCDAVWSTVWSTATIASAAAAPVYTHVGNNKIKYCVSQYFSTSFFFFSFLCCCFFASIWCRFFFLPPVCCCSSGSPLMQIQFFCNEQHCIWSSSVPASCRNDASGDSDSIFCNSSAQLLPTICVHGVPSTVKPLCLLSSSAPNWIVDCSSKGKKP